MTRRTEGAVLQRPMQHTTAWSYVLPTTNNCDVQVMVVINLVGQSRFFKSKVRWQMTSKSLNLQGEDSIVLWGDLASTVWVYFSHWVTANQSRIVLSTQFHSVMGHFFSPSLGHWLVWQGLKGCQSHIMQSTDAKPSEIFQTSVLEWVFHHHHSGDVFHPDCFFYF